MKKNILNGKKVVLSVMCAAMMLSSVTAFAANDEKNKVTFSNKVLPECSNNTTLASAKKSSNRKYGKVKITSFTNCSSVTCWLRTELSDGSYHYWLPYAKTISKKNQLYKVKYCDKKKAYYSTNTSVALRAENADETLTVWTEKISGLVYFN